MPETEKGERRDRRFKGMRGLNENHNATSLRVDLFVWV